MSKVMTDAERAKVIGHAQDHVAYKWAAGLPVRHDRRDWRQEEKDLYRLTYDNLVEKNSTRTEEGK